ncbi:4'-phosphopantetheinyl transferase [Rhodococcus sp. 15-725-2-2b]|uniref:4'-phosphopantetheinyl transferase Npt n=1 Tax=unclassified Rhodococcus (in: high G+C Gram-positive bacteria) TaxID=192944 RepID=UPI000B9C1CDE|nr:MULTISPECIES: 4'-phosphopantetheinyl transferase Npt [unclassified Rhodococcus (in: high G+C Gram-positive bacteria)]OZC61086.1 4'-phosphopantetheinyl transferase [Rhodococcus sp. 06-470-2]OZC71814.1 4'-phosphopantetheinyl transferase [Rhodococcus sp. 06-469-3-2]OZD42603.1 4'-phosphopantetheinyl transferase [Rhodococcus sp. 06-1477-1A]OZE06049.1 4'-phosphopantetheinyl transferase [Rhodococcus sp. 05-2255-3B1]OZE09258.1 4'-phosphopantetheinyl transferase [Rhodococcus sp. 05-2255-3C]
MIESILPNGVVSAELFADPPGLTPHPLEAPLVAKAVDKRKREFTSARHCARVAMEKLGVEPAPIMRGKSGAPQWPKGVVGSLTHCDGYRGAVLAYSMQVRSVGIDAEPHGPLPDGVLEAVSLPAEREWLEAAGREDIHWDRVLFCAKEATYKAWEPLTGRWLGFEDAHITFERTGSGDDLSGTFHSELLVPGDTVSGPPLSAFDGRWMVAGGLVMTAISVM